MDVFAANDLAAYNVILGSPIEMTNAGTFDATYCTKMINCSNASAGAIQSPHFIDPSTGANTTLTDMWFHGEIQCGNAGGGAGYIAAFVDSAGTIIARIALVTNGVVRLDYWNGAAFVNGASTFSIGVNKTIIDAHLVCGAAGTFTLYANNIQILQLTALNAAVDNVAFLNLSNAQTTAGWSQILCSDTNTIGVKVASLTPNSNSATNTAWTNDFNSIVKVSLNDATMISDATLGDKESYGATDVTLPAGGYGISTVWFAIRARVNGASPANIKPLLRMGGVDYAGSYNFGGLGTVTFGPSVAAFVNDPSTGALWSGSPIANLNGAEVGFQTAA